MMAEQTRDERAKQARERILNFALTFLSQPLKSKTVTETTVTITKSHNSHWAGRGRVISVDVESGVVILSMTTGNEKGNPGGFDLDKVRFHVKRANVDLSAEELAKRLGAAVE
jgi:hypothetical protein